jgi:hypothetical protein
MDYRLQIIRWLSEDPMRREALFIASTQGLRDWCLAAGFVRNLVWDKVHGFSCPTPLNDIDLIHFDPYNASEEADRDVERRLKATSELPWSVKNQARMHERNSDNPYTSTEDAMSYWVELETAVGASLDKGGDIVIVAPFGIDALFDFTITPNSKRLKPMAFSKRVEEKRWLEIWPKLMINAQGASEQVCAA